MEKTLLIILSVISGLAWAATIQGLYFLWRIRKPPETVTPEDLVDQINAIRLSLSGKIENISVGAGADTSGATGQSRSLQYKEKSTMGGTPLTLTDVKTALTGLQTDLAAVIDAETGDLRGAVQNLKDQIGSGTPVTQADLQGILDQINATHKSLTDKVQNISVGAGADTKGAAGTPAPAPNPNPVP